MFKDAYICFKWHIVSRLPPRNSKASYPCPIGPENLFHRGEKGVEEGNPRPLDSSSTQGSQSCLKTAEIATAPRIRMKKSASKKSEGNYRPRLVRLQCCFRVEPCAAPIAMGSEFIRWIRRIPDDAIPFGPLLSRGSKPLAFTASVVNRGGVVGEDLSMMRCHVIAARWDNWAA